MNRRRMILTAAVAMAITPISGYLTAAAAYPAKPIKLIVPTTAGSLPDVFARWLGERLAGALGQAVVIDNRAGAGGTIGLGAVASAASDGYTFGLLTGSFIVTPSLIAKMSYDTERDLAPVSLISWSYGALYVPAASPAHSVAELVTLAKANPRGLTYASNGNGTPPHLVLTLFGRQAGVTLVHIPYKGGPAATAATLAGEVDMTVGPQSLSLGQYIKTGRLRALASTAPRRSSAFPDLPTLIELGYAGVELNDWMGVVAPAGTPREVIDRVQSEIARILGTPEAKQELQAIGMEPAGMAPGEFAAYLRTEIPRRAKLVREAGITAD